MPVAPTVRIQADDFDIAHEIAAFGTGEGNTGAVVTFTGICRDEDGRLNALELEHYPGMAEGEITEIADNAIERFQLTGVTVIHRYGRIETGGNIVLVIASASHRRHAFDGASFVMDFLKSRAPFWKKEHGKDGAEGEWVAARDEDDAALDKWKDGQRSD